MNTIEYIVESKGKCSAVLENCMKCPILEECRNLLMSRPFLSPDQYFRGLFDAAKLVQANTDL